ncbi:RluA family pseudouridine synthase [Sphingobium phenoxybenzoativorans]|uniref:Ribosomal large subunit pseudouridine synthase D n=1 Tax=Sphingobium phenoxybenzoativorans TaxID=1592790 RepID=A0A975K7S3_9SPHN|nr:RluA family pseudouridine synthase [Sphingobium phenoxybenzoativorans]QUT06361.1 RluA family pseudouridine synthase [Sphingobium phenoxybenzoativorans]
MKGAGKGPPKGPPKARGKGPAKNAAIGRSRAPGKAGKPEGRDAKAQPKFGQKLGPKFAKGGDTSGGKNAPARAAKPAGAKPKAPVRAAEPKSGARPVAAAAKDAGVTLDVRQFRVAPDDDGIRLDRWFQRNLPDVGFNIVSRWARTGQLRVDGARAAPGDRIAEGQTIRVPPAEEKAARPDKPERPKRARIIDLTDDEIAYAQEMVIHTDAQAIVINKPPGLATQGGTKTDTHVDRLLDALMFDSEQRPKLVHRLDKDTSGALLIARSARSAGYFAKAFSSRTARKIYWAIVIGVPDIHDGMIELPLAKQPGTGGEKMHVDEKEGLPARSRYRVIDRAGNRAAWVELQPFSGRTHQLRVHMAAIGHPIVGDGKYGGKDAFLSGTISRKMHLHARRIRIDHPDGGHVDVKAELPAHFRDSLEDLGFDLTLGDMPLDEEIDTSPTREDEKKFARQHAKAVRKERRGERRGRGAR